MDSGFLGDSRAVCSCDFILHFRGLSFCSDSSFALYPFLSPCELIFALRCVLFTFDHCLYLWPLPLTPSPTSWDPSFTLTTPFHTLILPHHPTCHPWPRPLTLTTAVAPVTPLFASWSILLTLPFTFWDSPSFVALSFALWPLFDLWLYTSPLRIPLFTHFIRDPILCLVTTSTSMWPVFLTVVPIISLWTSFFALWPLPLTHPSSVTLSTFVVAFDHWLFLVTSSFALWPVFLTFDRCLCPATPLFWPLISTFTLWPPPLLCDQSLWLQTLTPQTPTSFSAFFTLWPYLLQWPLFWPRDPTLHLLWPQPRTIPSWWFLEKNLSSLHFSCLSKFPATPTRLVICHSALSFWALFESLDRLMQCISSAAILCSVFPLRSLQVNL